MPRNKAHGSVQMFAKVDYTATGARLLSPANPPVSDIYKAIRATVVEFQISSFERFAFDIDIFREEKAASRDEKPGLGYQHEERFLLKPEADKPRVVRACITKHGKVKLKLGKYWKPPGTYFKTLHIPMDPNRDLAFDSRGLANCFIHQQNWWKCNGKSFNFLGLPAELRGAIYSSIVGPYVEPFPDARCRVQDIAPVRYRVNVGLFAVCHQIYHEMRKHMHELTPFFFNSRSVLCRFLHPIPRLRAPAQHVTKLHIKLSLEEYMHLFGVQLLDRATFEGYEWRPASDSALLALNRMPLKELKLDIGLHASLQDTLQEPNHETICDICQKKFVDIMLETAWPHIRGHPVELTGFVKSAQKIAFEAKAAHTHEMKKLGFAGWEDEEDKLDGGVRLDGMPIDSVDLHHSATFVAPAPEDHKPLEVDLPFNCECRPRCWEKWTVEDEPEEE